MKLVAATLVLLGFTPKPNCSTQLSARSLESVANFAIAAHANQRYGSQPYKVHLVAVNAVLNEFGINDLNDPLHVNILRAGWIHDVIEDTSTPRENIVREAGVVAEDFAWRVSDGEGQTRAERKAAAYAKISGNLGATIVKLADRIANTRASGALPKKMTMYMGEYPHFRQILFDPNMRLAQPFWEELDRLYRVFGP